MANVSAELTSHCIAALGGSSETLFPEVTFNAVQERFIFNPNSTATLWINLWGNQAAPNGYECISLAPLTGWAGKITNAITVFGPAGAKVTAGEH